MFISYIFHSRRKCNKGDIYIDGQSISNNLEGWQKNIGYIPQKVVILENTLRENILFGLNKKKISKCFEKLKNVKGRVELVKEYPDQTKVFIDFAHTPEAIKTVINSLRNHFKRDVTIVFGCGGERDKNKREKIKIGMKLHLNG